MKKISYIIVSMIVLLGLVWICLPKEKEYHKTLFYMDTYIDIQLIEKDSKKALQALQEIESIYQEYHQLTNRYEEYEGVINLYTIKNNTFEDEVLTLSPKLYALLEYSEKWKQQSQGLLNIEMGNVIDVWKKYRDQNSGIPTQEELEEASSQMVLLELLGNYQIKNNHPNLDLGAIAKGYATALVKEYLESQKITSYIINAGGNVIVGEKKNGYHIGIEDPTKKGTIFTKVTGEKISVVTSGGYERFYEYEGNTYHHIIDPVTLYPPNYFKSVTVIAFDSALADAFSTILFLMPVSEGLDFVQAYEGVEAIWYLDDGQIVRTEGFMRYESA